MLEDIKSKININAKGITKEINNSASIVSEMAKNRVDSVVLTVATQIVTKSMSGIASKGFSYINNDKKYTFVFNTFNKK